MTACDFLEFNRSLKFYHFYHVHRKWVFVMDEGKTVTCYVWAGDAEHGDMRWTALASRSLAECNIWLCGTYTNTHSICSKRAILQDFAPHNK